MACQLDYKNRASNAPDSLRTNLTTQGRCSPVFEWQGKVEFLTDFLGAFELPKRVDLLGMQTEASRRR